MLTHIVWWTLKPEADGKSAAENAALLKERLEKLQGLIPSLKGISVGLHVQNTSTEKADLVLVTRHDDDAGLAAYASHPEHLAVGDILKNVVLSRKSIDFLE